MPLYYKRLNLAYLNGYGCQRTSEEDADLIFPQEDFLPGVAPAKAGVQFVDFPGSPPTRG